MAERQPSETTEVDAAAHNGAGQQEPLDENSTTAGEDSNKNEATVKKATLCGVCEKTASKYKCPRCYLPYCSVACNKMHRETHPPDPKPAPKPAAESQPPMEPPTDSATENPQDPSGRPFKHPFRTLQHSEQLQWLFRKYPRLPDQLLEIHAATQEPPTEKSKIPASLLKDLPTKRDGWNRDKGVACGKEALREARKAEGEDGEAIREYSELVLHFLGESRRKRGQ